jgi:tripartite-type tricarboxylate transporter receptor subunit TctC
MGTHATAVALYPNLAYQPDIDFAPIGLVNGVPSMIVARKDFPSKDLKEFVPYVKANAQKLNVAHAGVGSSGFTCSLLVNSIIGVKPTMVPFNGGSPAMNALLSGQVDYMCDGGINLSLPYVLSGGIKAYAIGAEQRSPVLPHVPTSKEAGLPEFQVSSWHALFSPKGTPKPILDKLAEALDKALDDDNSRKRLLDLGFEIPDKASRGQQPLAALVKSEMARWTAIIRAANIK